MFIFHGLFLGDCDARQVIKGVFPSGRLSICTHWQNEFYEDGVCRILWKPNHPLQEAGHQTSFLVFTKASDKAAQPVAVYRSHVVSPILILQGNYWARHFFSALNILLNYVTLCIMEQKLEFNNIITRLYIDKHVYCREQTWISENEKRDTVEHAGLSFVTPPWVNGSVNVTLNWWTAFRADLSNKDSQLKQKD